MTDIANSVMPGIVMEFDVPSRNSSDKMAILDMEDWMEEDGNIMFQHYEKPSSSKTIMHAKSALSVSCRNSVHTHLARMVHCGYPEKYRIDTLTRALRIYDKMENDDKDGTRPLYRPKEWNIEARKKYYWSTRGNILPPLLFPPPQTVNSHKC